MIDIAVRLIAAFLAHPVHGINAMAANLPRDQFAVPGDTPAQDDAPPTVEIFNDADDLGVATKLTPPSLPSIVVWGDSSADADVGNKRTAGQAKDVVVAIAYMTDDTADDLTANRVCGYLMRAAKRTLRRFNSQSDATGYRELNGVRVLEATRVDEQRITMAGEGGNPVLWGWLAVHLRVVDMVA